ncbi:MAG TPA: cupin domain-containing protein [Acidimicrobiales bacterium]|nr:cupin domain-containing protein [Acidimicrobiales bacterium]
MISVRSWDYAFEDDGRDGTVEGYAHRGLVDRSMGAVHTDLGLCRLNAGATLPRHVHSFEQCAYVLAGRPAVAMRGSTYLLEPGDYVFFAVGEAHAWHNPGGEDACWLELGTPQAAGPGGRPDTFVLKDGGGASTGAGPGAGPSAGPGPGAFAGGGSAGPSRLSLSDPTARLGGHYHGTDSQLEALAVRDQARGRAPAGMDTALLAYSGISVKMMVDPGLGADLMTMFMVDYEPGGAAQVHDHPFEEAYFFLQGEIDGEIEGELRTFRAGEVLFCGVGVLHGFFNTGGGHVRWIETQAPQPPRRHSYRWPAHWARVAAGGERDGG